ncbi:hypothetical protein AB205_0145210 [Aquarana catesbeiana]|uniref:Uncharacterized protein n=1 Tax=Aquarana catesbeiana TaxID=8400 RepID=A0A2G9R688_AQUCT|nr:hypothetical protein AB205_0145210 [Aquarana catesbeiana]
MSLERGRNTGRQIGIHVPQATAYCQVVSSGNYEDGGDGDDDEVTDATWVPDRAEEETEGETAQPQGGRHQERVESSHTIPSHSAAVISQPTPQSSAVWAFFSTSAADHNDAICKLCLRHIKSRPILAFIKSTSIGLWWEGATDTQRPIFLHPFDRCISLQFLTARPILAFLKITSIGLWCEDTTDTQRPIFTHPLLLSKVKVTPECIQKISNLVPSALHCGLIIHTGSPAVAEQNKGSLQGKCHFFGFINAIIAAADSRHGTDLQL